MATARETIITGLEALRVLGFGRNLPAAHADYCLKQLNGYLRQLLGFGGSLPMASVRSADFSSALCGRYPAIRVLCTSGGEGVSLPERAPPDGMRLEVVDVARTAATSNIVIARNGWLIDGSAANYAITANGGRVMLMFRADLGDWLVIPSDGYTLDDELPFPADCDEAIALNAARRYSRFGQRLSEDDMRLSGAGANRLRARYAKPPRVSLDPAVSYVGGERRYGGSTADFLNGVE